MGGVQRVVVVGQIVLTPFPFSSMDLTKYIDMDTKEERKRSGVKRLDGNYM